MKRLTTPGKNTMAGRPRALARMALPGQRQTQAQVQKWDNSLDLTMKSPIGDKVG